jgi:thiamine biosynthesis lipoprotein
MGRLARVLLCAALAVCLSGCAPKEYTGQIFAMDTYMELTAYGKNAEVALKDIIGTINQYSVELDPEVEKSTVYALNHADGKEVTVDPAIADMLATAKKVYDQTVQGSKPLFRNKGRC